MRFELPIRAAKRKVRASAAIACALGILAGCSSYRAPAYPESSARPADYRVEVHIAIREKGERRVILGAVERAGLRLTTVLYSPLGATLLVHSGEAPPRREELAGSGYRPLLDLLYETYFHPSVVPGSNWRVISGLEGEHCAVIDAVRLEACLRRR